MTVDDTRRRQRPRDPDALLFCMKCNRVKASIHFGYQENPGRYRTQCNDCRSKAYANYAYRKTTEDPGYYAKLLEINRKSHAKTAELNREYRRMVQSRIAYMLKDLRKSGVFLKDIAADIGISPRHMSKFAGNKAGRTPRPTLARVEQGVQRWHDKHVRKLI